MKSFLTIATLVLSLVSGFAATNTNVSVISPRELTNRFRLMVNPRQFDTNVFPLTITNFAGLTGGFEITQFTTNNGVVSIVPGVVLTNANLVGGNLTNITVYNGDNLTNNGLVSVVGSYDNNSVLYTNSASAFYTNNSGAPATFIIMTTVETAVAGGGTLSSWVKYDGSSVNTFQKVAGDVSLANANTVTNGLLYIHVISGGSIWRSNHVVTPSGTPTGAVYWNLLRVR